MHALVLATDSGDHVAGAVPDWVVAAGPNPSFVSKLLNNLCVPAVPPLCGQCTRPHCRRYVWVHDCPGGPVCDDFPPRIGHCRASQSGSRRVACVIPCFQNHSRYSRSSSISNALPTSAGARNNGNAAVHCFMASACVVGEACDRRRESRANTSPWYVRGSAVLRLAAA